MKFAKLNSDKIANVNIFNYKLDFNDITGSKPEVAVKTFLKPFWSKDLVLDEFVIPGSRLRVDILNISKKVAIEVSPASTHSFNKFFHGNIAVFAQRLKKEISKEQWCIKHGFQYIELGDEELANLTKKMFKEKFEINL
jgi:hypothetical protein